MESDNGDRRFDHGELGDLLKMFSALGVTVAVGITVFFFIGLRADAWMAEAGWRMYGAGKIAGLLFGLGLTGYWSYLRIIKHLRKYEDRKE